MKTQKIFSKIGLAIFPMSVLSLAISSSTFAQEVSEQVEQDEESQPKKPSFKVQLSNPVEEVLVLGRQQSSAQDLVLERVEFESVVDLLGAEQISRLGDSTAAAALKRVPGVTLVNGQFIYVRGLGERYSSSLLNGATVPSPDLTRNVLPLDIFPASIIQSIAVQKGYTANMPASFGGGNIDIRTNGLPDGPVFSFELSAGINSDSDEGLNYVGGSNDHLGKDDGTRALSPAIDGALRQFFGSVDSPEGSLDPSAIEATARRNGQPITFEQAEAINAQLATEVFRGLDVETTDSSIQDGSANFALGNVFSLNDELEFGAIATVNYGRSSRTDNRIQRAFDDPTEEFQDQQRTTKNVNITGSLNFGLRWNDDHEVASKNLFLRNTDDEISITNVFNTTSQFSSGQGSRDNNYRFEQRELKIYQLNGNHKLGYDTREKFGFGESIFDDLEFNWFYSDSTATTEIPLETNIRSNITLDVQTGEVVASRITQGLRAVDVRFTDLKDEVESSGFEAKLPMSFGDWEIELSGGGKYDKKARSYGQLDLSIGSSTAAAASTLTGPISQALSDTNLTNPDFDYRISYQSGLSRSYLAATITDAAFGQADFLWNNTWRLAIGARYEDYKQFSAPWQPYRINGSQLRIDPTSTSANGFPDGTFNQDDVYPSAALTYSRQDFWAEDFNLRFAVSETVVRPDLREVSDSSYLDPLTDIVVNGNPDVIPSDITNFDARAEWFFGNGDNLTVSLFFKDIKNPIEYLQGLGAEDSITATIENTESGESKGIEVEWIKGFSFLGDFASQFFVSGNVTLADSEIKVGDSVDVAVTNRIRPLRGASDYVANIQLGYDSEDGKHAATLIYNVFGERVFSGGVGEQPDAFEQPFNALDISYAYYLNDNFTFKLKARNLLDDKILIQQGNVDIYEQTVGQSFSVSAKYNF